MTTESKNLILTILNDNLNSLIGTFLHLEHQSKLQPEHRIIDMSSEELASNIKHIYAQKTKLQIAITELVQ